MDVSFPWSPLEAALTFPNFSIFVKKKIFEKELIKANGIAINAKS
jgi:hypothetical protein